MITDYAKEYVIYRYYFCFFDIYQKTKIPGSLNIRALFYSFIQVEFMKKGNGVKLFVMFRINLIKFSFQNFATGIKVKDQKFVRKFE